MVGQDSPERKHSWFYRPKPNTKAHCTLICFHYAGGSAQIFRSWGAAFDPIAEVLAIQLPGRGDSMGTPPITRMSTLVDELCTRLSPLLSSRPFALFGHSLGALVAFETARKLQKPGQSPVALFVSAKSPPQRSHAREPVHQLDDEDFLAAMIRRYQGAPNMELLGDPELRKLFLPVIRGDMTLLESYQYEENVPLAFPIVAIGGTEDPAVPITALAGWEAHTSARFELWPYPGGHFFWLPNASPLISGITEYLREALLIR